MDRLKSFRFLVSIGLGLLTYSCSDPKDKDFSAYFGGEIVNPKDKWVLFYKGETLIDSIPLDQNNRFFVKFDSLTPGLYTFSHEPEYQYVYFDKNDSLMLRVNTHNFDESIVFCGKGEEKNNFLVDMYLKSQDDRNLTFSDFDLDEKEFSRKADSFHKELKKIYDERKEFIAWNEDFDLFARASIDFPYYTKKEFYPVAYKRRSALDKYPELPKNYYNYRNNIDFNNKELLNYSQYLRYINTLVENLSKNEPFERIDLKKLEILDSLTTNQELKNKISSTIALVYIIDKEDNAKDKVFMNKFMKISTDNAKKEEIKSLVNSISTISEKGYLPEITLRDFHGNEVSSTTIFQQKTIVYFWSKKNAGHFMAVHKKLDNLLEKYPNIDAVGICLDDNSEDWRYFWNKNKNVPNSKIRQYRMKDLTSLKKNWVITRVTRASVVDKDGKIVKGFVNIFDPHFEKEL